MRYAVLVMSVLLCVAAAGCGGGGKKSAAATTTVTTVTTVETATTSTETTTSVKTHGRFNYPPVVVTNFMKSCTNGIKKREAYCGCTLDKLSNTVSVQDFARIGLSGGKLTSRIQRLIRNAAVGCADKL